MEMKGEDPPSAERVCVRVWEAFSNRWKGKQARCSRGHKINNNTKIDIFNISKKLKNDQKKTPGTEVCPAEYKRQTCARRREGLCQQGKATSLTGCHVPDFMGLGFLTIV